MERIALIYSTFSTQDDALKILHQLIEEGFATCGNIAAPHIAVYPWQGRLEQTQETSVLIKAPSDKQDALIDRLRIIHPYELPCILSVDATALPDYAKWLRQPS